MRHRVFANINRLFGSLDDLYASWPLRGLGAGLSLCLVWTFWLWSGWPQLLRFAPHTGESLCWPWFSACDQLKVFSTSVLQDLFLVLIVVSSVMALLFLLIKPLKWLWLLLLTLHIIKLFFFFADYRNMGNYHYMHFLCFVVFAFLPNKIATYKYLVVGFYFFAGLLKLNMDWLSGWAIPPLWIVEGSPLALIKAWGLLPTACIYVVVLELVFSFGLLTKNKFVFWLSFLQFVVFHIFSWSVVGFFYPLVMLSLLVLFVLDGFYPESKAGGLEAPPKSWFSRGFLLIFILAQIYPKIISFDSALTGEGRFWSLNMFDAFTSCEVNATANFKNGDVINYPMGLSEWDGIVRIWCDPYVYYSKAKKICDNFKDNSEFNGLSLKLVSKRVTDETFFVIIDEQNMCSEGLGFNMFYNHWINHRAKPDLP